MGIADRDGCYGLVGKWLRETGAGDSYGADGMSETSYIYEATDGAPIKMWMRGVSLEASAHEQLLNVASMPFIHKHLAVMPDVHWGMGATIGSVIPTKGAIIPAAVGCCPN